MPASKWNSRPRELWFVVERCDNSISTSNGIPIFERFAEAIEHAKKLAQQYDNVYFIYKAQIAGDVNPRAAVFDEDKP